MKVTTEVIAQIYELARQGISNKMIYESLGISKSNFYSKAEILDAVKKAKLELVKEVSQNLLNQAQSDTTTLIFLSKRLNLFANELQINLKSPENALASLELIANADISLEHKNALKSIISEYFKAYEVTELDKRLTALESKVYENEPKIN